MKKIKIYKNRYGKDPLVVGTVGMGEMRSTLGSDYKGMVWCPYIPMMITPVYTPSIWKRLESKFQHWFWDISHSEHKSKYLMECLQDLYKKYGKKHYIMTVYSSKTVNKRYYSKIKINDAED